jgi:predicted ArsR family transcriptional regulator
MQATQNDHVRVIDQTALELLRQGDGWTVQELAGELGVTATAVRQRLDRLSELRFVDREKVSVGRGRPLFRYRLTKAGMRFASVSYAELASALWHEILDLDDCQLRESLLKGVARRLGAAFRQVIPQNGNLTERLAATATELNRRKVPAVVRQDSDELPILEVQACPYPDLIEADDSRQLCEIEQEMIGEALGQAVSLDCCRRDGHDLCQFKPIQAGEHAASG